MGPVCVWGGGSCHRDDARPVGEVMHRGNQRVMQCNETRTWTREMQVMEMEVDGDGGGIETGVVEMEDRWRQGDGGRWRWMEMGMREMEVNGEEDGWGKG